jgi:hypothetical protein
MTTMTFRSRWICAALLLLASSGAAQGRTPTSLRASGETLYTLRLPAEATDLLPGNANAVAFGPQGRLFMLDRASGAVWIFDQRGTLERRADLGETGRTAVGMAVTRDGRVVVSDPSRRALVVVDPARPAGARTHALGELMPSGALAAHPDGGVVVQARQLPSLSTGEWSRDLHFRWFPLDGRPPSTLRTVAPAPGARSGAVGVSAMPLLTAVPGGTAVAADPRSYRVVLTTGGRARTLERSLPGRPLTPVDRTWLDARARCSPARMVGPSGAAADPSMLAGARQGASQPLPERVSAVARLGWSPAGQLWIERPGPRLDRPGIVDVYRADGGFVGSLDGAGVPDAWSPDGGTAAYVTRGADCRTTVTVRRLQVGPAR